MKIQDPFIVAYDWYTWKNFLLPNVLPEAVRLTANPGESAGTVISFLPKKTSVFIFHICLSCTNNIPHQRNKLIDALKERNILIINKHVTDVSKRHIQHVCQRAGIPSVFSSVDGAKDELVIVKSNYNYGGEAERRLTQAQRKALGIDSIPGLIKNSRAYSVLPRCEVPADYWRCDSLTIEKFIENPEHIFFRVYVAGLAVAISKVKDPSLFKKMPVGIDRQTATYLCGEGVLLPIDQPFFPSQNLLSILYQFIKEFELDYGALDIVFQQPDDFFIIDVNNTPHWGDGGHTDLLNFLRKGIFDLINSNSTHKN